MQLPLPVETVLAERYAVLKSLYLGTAGWIYLAIDQTTNKLYVLEETAADLDELQAVLAALNLRHVAQYHDVIAYFDQAYLVRNYIEGHSHRELLAQQQLFSEAEVLRFLNQGLLILRSLQRRKIAHQNLTLNSMIRRSDGSLMLTEFTQARFAETFDSDLYHLAVIAIVLLTGCEPKALFNEALQQWEWHDGDTVDPRVARVLDHMLSFQLQSRYPTAAKVLNALSAPDPQDLASIVLTFVLIGLAAIAAYRLINHLSGLQSTIVIPSTIVAPSPVPSPSPAPIGQRVDRLKVSQALLTQLSSETSQAPETLLKQLEFLSPQAHSGMGTYKRATYEAWQTQRSSSLSDRAIEILADAQFVARFPDQKGKVLNPRTFGQVWYAIAFDRIKQAKSEPLSSPLHGTLEHGFGKVYRSQFKQGQTIQLSLKAPTNQLSIWMFSEETSVIQNLSQSSWSGKLPRSGTYELIVAPKNLSTVQYKLQIETSN